MIQPISKSSNHANQTVCLSSAYLAPIAYYSKLYAYSHAIIEQHDHYVKQTYRNRCVIATANGPLALTIPTESNAGAKCIMRDVRISDHGNWRHLHWNALESAYRQSPFYEYYADDFRPFYEKHYTFLFDFNEELCQLVCSLIGFAPHIIRSAEYISAYSSETDDFRELIHPKCDFRTDRDFHAHPYYQVFNQRHGFLPNLSIVDLLFNMGPESLLVLRNSCSI